MVERLPLQLPAHFFLNAKNGNLDKQLTRPQSPLRTPDRIIWVKGEWIIISENGISCYNSDSSNTHWQYDLSGYFKAVSTYSAKVDSFKTLNNSSSHDSNKLPSLGISNSDYYILAAQRNVEHWNNEYARNPTLYTREVSKLADRSYINTLNVNKAFDQMMANASIIMAGQSIGMAIYEALAKELDYAGLRRAQASYFLASKESMLTHQGEYYIRRFETKKKLSVCWL